MTSRNISYYSEGFAAFAEPSAFNRFFKHEQLVEVISKLPETFKVSVAGYSVAHRSIHLLEWGKGPVKVFLWSQMHGDEATGTLALLDLISFLQQGNYTGTLKQLMENCTLYLMPMVNPDGAASFIRRNAQQIDINRDFLKAVSPEAQLLKSTREKIQPDFGFNLHDQNTLWSVTGSKKPATLSFLAPAFDQELSIDDTRKNAMLVIAEIFEQLSPLLPGQIGLFDDEYEPRAFGDNFQKAGTSTILIEAGGFLNDDEKQAIRKYYFLSVLSGLVAIAGKSYLEKDLKHYAAIPKNNKQIFHVLIHGLNLQGIPLSIGLNYDEMALPSGKGTVKTYVVQDIGDLDLWSAYHTIDASKLKTDAGIEFGTAPTGLENKAPNEVEVSSKETDANGVNAIRIEGAILLNKNADFRLFYGKNIILSFKNGILESKL